MGQTFLLLDGRGQPVPYLYQVTVNQDFSGLAGKYFDFPTPAQFIFQNQPATGTGGPFALATSFTYGFTFTATTDVGGFACPAVSSSSSTLNPPVGCVTGFRSDFLMAPPPVDQVDLIQTWSAIAFGAPVPAVTSASSSGTLQITYSYIPAPIPEPATLLLLGTGLAAVAARRRFAKRT